MSHGSFFPDTRPEKKPRARVNGPAPQTAPPVLHRYVDNGDGTRTWRPSAPGFPDSPRVPQGEEVAE